jgi:hypothetical protein
VLVNYYHELGDKSPTPLRAIFVLVPTRSVLPNDKPTMFSFAGRGASEHAFPRGAWEREQPRLQDAERPSRHSHAERGNEKTCSRSHAPRGNAGLDAPRPAELCAGRGSSLRDPRP